MFNKTSKPTSRPDAMVPPPVTPPVDVSPALNLNKVTPPMSSPLRTQGTKGFSTLGSGLVIEGNVSGAGDLVLEGTVHGDIKVSHLTVGEAGNVEGKIEADTIEIRGRVVGSIKGQQIKLQATAYVEGDITHEQLAIDVGAYFQGRCLQTRRVDQNAAAPATAPLNAVPAASAPAASPAPSAAASAPAATPTGGPSLNSYDLNALADLK